MRNVVLRELQRWYTDYKPAVVFDVGANVGQSTQEFRHYFPEALIHAFEPVTASFDELRKATEGDSLVRCHKVALGAASGTGQVTRNGTSTGNRLVATAKSQQATEDVEIVAGDDFCSREGVGRIDFLKIDAEGYDLKVLVGFTETLRRRAVAVLQVEIGLVPENRQHVSLDAVRGYLEPLGYRIFRLAGFKSIRSRPPVLASADFADVIFVAPQGLE